MATNWQASQSHEQGLDPLQFCLVPCDHKNIFTYWLREEDGVRKDARSSITGKREVAAEDLSRKARTKRCLRRYFPPPSCFCARWCFISWRWSSRLFSRPFYGPSSWRACSILCINISYD